MRKLIVLAAALTTLGLAGISGPAQAKVPGPDGQIVFSRSHSSTTENFAVATVNPDGTQVRELTTGECPHWSPDGSLIATCGALDGGASVIINPDTGSFRELFPPDLSLHLACPVWSPDAQRLACGQFDNAADPSRDGMYTIRSSDADGSWSPNGNWILFDSKGSLYVVHPDGTGLAKLPLATSSLSRAFSPGWSPSGTKIVFALFTRTSPGTEQEGIYTAKADGSHIKQVTSAPIHDTGPDWGTHPLAS